MEYLIDKEALKDKVIKEISRFAAGAHADDGSSLFDAYKILSRDHATILDYIEGGVSAICVRLIDISSKEDNKIVFDISDFIPSMEGPAKEELDRYIVYNACWQWVEDKAAAEGNPYKQRADEALANANILLKTRKSPKSYKK